MKPVRNDMFRSRLDQIIDLGHEKVILAGKNRLAISVR